MCDFYVFHPTITIMYYFHYLHLRYWIMFVTFILNNCDSIMFWCFVIVLILGIGSFTFILLYRYRFSDSFSMYALCFVLLD